MMISVLPRQTGGSIMAAQMYLIGESGPELFLSGQGGMMVPNPSTYSGVGAVTAGQSLGGFHLGGLTIHTGAGINDVQSFAHEASQQLATQFRGQLIQALRGARPGLGPGTPGIRR